MSRFVVIAVVVMFLVPGNSLAQLKTDSASKPVRFVRLSNVRKVLGRNVGMNLELAISGTQVKGVIAVFDGSSQWPDVRCLAGTLKTHVLQLKIAEWMQSDFNGEPITYAIQGRLVQNNGRYRFQGTTELREGLTEDESLTGKAFQPDSVEVEEFHKICTASRS